MPQRSQLHLRQRSRIQQQNMAGARIDLYLTPGAGFSGGVDHGSVQSFFTGSRRPATAGRARPDAGPPHAQGVPPRLAAPRRPGAHLPARRSILGLCPRPRPSLRGTGGPARVRLRRGGRSWGASRPPRRPGPGGVPGTPGGPPRPSASVPEAALAAPGEPWYGEAARPTREPPRSGPDPAGGTGPARVRWPARGASRATARRARPLDGVTACG